MKFDIGVEAIAHVIQLSVAPVFLLTGVGALLGVLTNRLSRIIDRARKLHDIHETAEREGIAAIEDELDTLTRRAQGIYLAIALCTTAALLVCSVIVTLFFGTFAETDLSRWVAWLFITAMLALIGALVSFLREVMLATRNLRIRRGHVPPPHARP